MSTEYAARDFVETHEGLLFAVMVNGIQAGRVIGFLRYRRNEDRLAKLDTNAADALLDSRFPDYLYYSPRYDRVVHAVPISRICRHLVPHDCARQLVSRTTHRDRVQSTAAEFLRSMIAAGLSSDVFGITGSLLVGAHGSDSDVDVIVSSRDQFHRARRLIQRELERGQIKPLSREFWDAAYCRRGCSLSLDEYMWHERRKFNKLSLNGIKIDLSLALRDPPIATNMFRKVKRVDFTTLVMDDRWAYDHPATWKVDSKIASRVVSWTPTFAGQALQGERIRVRGWLEESQHGSRQVVVGSSREAAGESIIVIDDRP